MSFRVYHAGRSVRRGVFRFVFVHVRRQQLDRAAPNATATTATVATAVVTARATYTTDASATADTDTAAAAAADTDAGRRHVVRARRSHAGRLPHAGQPVKRRRLHPLDQTVQRLHRL